MAYRDAREHYMKKQSDAVRNIRPVEITLLRKTAEPDGAGGIKKETQVGVGPQMVRLIAGSSSANQSPRRTLADGSQVVPTWFLFGEPDFDVLLGDQAEVPHDEDERIVQVVFISRNTPDRVIAECVEVGNRA